MKINKILEMRCPISVLVKAFSFLCAIVLCVNGAANELGYCGFYHGNVCKAHVSGHVWYSLGDISGGWENEKIATGLWEEMISDLTGVCRTAAEVTTSQGAFLFVMIC